MPGYILVSSDRNTNEVGGSVAIYIKNHEPCWPFESLNQHTGQLSLPPSFLILTPLISGDFTISPFDWLLYRLVKSPDDLIMPNSNNTRTFEHYGPVEEWG